MCSTFFSQPGWTSGSFSGHNYRYLSIKPGDPSKLVFLLLHTYPSGPLEFASIVPLLTAKGYGVIAPELLGYGESDRPTNLKAYARKQITDSLAALLHHEQAGKVVVIGHDIGINAIFSAEIAMFLICHCISIHFGIQVRAMASSYHRWPDPVSQPEAFQIIESELGVNQRRPRTSATSSCCT